MGRSPCSPPSSIVSPRDGNHVSPLESLPYAQSPIEQWNDSYADDDSTTEENNPFAAMPGIEDWPLAGLRSGLSRPVKHLTTSERQKALWRQARGGMEVRQVKTFRSEVLYEDGIKIRHSCHQSYTSGYAHFSTSVDGWCHLEKSTAGHRNNRCCIVKGFGSHGGPHGRDHRDCRGFSSTWA